MIDYVDNIRKSGVTIYDSIDCSDTDLYIPIYELERILSEELIGFSLKNLPLRTRALVVKTEICQALGYPIPASFKKTQPKFIGQNFDVYVQKSLNVQIWNEEVDPNRRYIFLGVDSDDIIFSVRVISGNELAAFDKTGTLTKKYQAKMVLHEESFCSQCDTSYVESWTSNFQPSLQRVNPNDFPQRGELFKIYDLYLKLLPIVGYSVDCSDSLQERNRGAALHAMVCKTLGYKTYEDNGQYPDITNQLLEVKLQTSATIDLGLYSPENATEVLTVDDKTFCTQDIRYAVFAGEVSGKEVLLKELYLVTGKEFPLYFPLFGGRQVNKKLQIVLPRDFFD